MTTHGCVAGAADALPPAGVPGTGGPAGPAPRGDAGASAAGGESGELSPWFADLADEDEAPEAEPFLGEDDELPEGIVELDELTDDPPAPEPLAGGDAAEDAPDAAAGSTPGAPVPPRRRPGRRMVKPEWRDQQTFSTADRILVLDVWQRSGLAATDMAPLLRLSPGTLRSWRRKFDELGPEGLVDAPRGKKKGSTLPEATKRAIIMLKEANPDFGTQRISDMLLRGPALAASPGTVARVLKEAGYVTEDVPSTVHEPKVTRFERTTPNALWQTDLFTFTLKRTNRRVYLVAFMDDHSRFITSFGLHGSASTAMVIEALEAGIASYGVPTEILTDNGPQYVTWRGKSAFHKDCDRRGILQVVSSPRHPETLGKIERFWKTLWGEWLGSAMLADLGEARSRIAHFIDYHNFQRPNQALDGLVPADRFFAAAPEVHRTLKARVAANALELARNGPPKTPFYLTGNVGGKSFSVHAEGERILMRHGDGEPREIELTPPEPAGAVPAEQATTGPAVVSPTGDATRVEAPKSSAAPVEAPPQSSAVAPVPPPAGDDAHCRFLADNVRRIAQSLRDAGRK